VFKATYGYDVEVQQFGKPEKATYDYAALLMQKQATRKGVEIGNCYMIGDNPRTDIAGGNRVGMTTILVKTGVFDPTAETSLEGNDREHPATHVVEDLESAINLIFTLEGL
jgi:ribonucleotide monophosphatase NagD (HAD superfamily)